MIKINKSKKGFTLVEVIIAMVLIMGTVAIFSTVAYSSIKVGNSNKQSLEGSIIAQNYLEVIKSNKESGSIKDFATLESFIKTSDFTLTEGRYFKTHIKDNIKYDVYIRLTITESSEVGELIDIIMEVKPQDGKLIKMGTKLYLVN
ncbi:hypothetical protein GCM10008905_03600 [Clostridium malenominatum]|uniref:Prepilin-type N-terminal cleavage/methylation domain-containing protein n=1 Tax=Clostridium malenominatum TaxID=1539 RepID=A0ABP3TTM7_9CLOT